MAYLYGDSTPFPLDDNFLDTLRAVTDTCVSLLKIDQGLDESLSRSVAARADFDAELGRVEALAHSLVKAMEPHVTASESTSEHQVAVRLLQSAKQVLEAARSELTHRRDAALAEVDNLTVEGRNNINQALEGFLSSGGFPGTVFRMRWKGGIAEEPAKAQTKLSTRFGLEAILEIEVPLSHAFAHPLKVGDLDKNVAIKLPAPGSWLHRGPQLRREVLDGYYVTEMEISPERAAMVLRKSNKHASAGLEVLVRAEDQAAMTVKRLAEEGAPSTDEIVLEGEDAATLQRLWAMIDAAAGDLVGKRRRLLRAAFDGVPVEEIERPARLAEKIVASIAPLVREMRARGASATELVLKRDLGNGRREELYVARAEIARKWAELAAPRRAIFDAFDLGDRGGGGADTIRVEPDDEPTKSGVPRVA